MSWSITLSEPILHYFKVHFSLAALCLWRSHYVGEHSPGCNHLFSFITGEMEKVREIIRTLEWSQSFTPPVRSPLRVIHLASLTPPSPTSTHPLPPLHPPPPVSQGFGHRHYSWTSAACWIFHSLRRDEKRAAPLTWKLTCRHRDYGLAHSFQAELDHAESGRDDDSGWVEQRQNNRIWERNLLFLMVRNLF